MFLSIVYVKIGRAENVLPLFLFALAFLEKSARLPERNRCLLIADQGQHAVPAALLSSFHRLTQFRQPGRIIHNMLDLLQ